ncbi:MAG: winged helix-turn-helix domain-containing protein [Mobilitalea sp.]
MSEKVKIIPQVNLLNEAYMLLYYIINEGSLETVKADYAQHYLLDADSYNRRFDLIIGLYDHIKSNLKVDKSRLEYYFKKRSVDFSTYAGLSVMVDYFDYECHTLLPYNERISQLSEEARIRLYAKIISEEDALNITEDKLSTLADLITFLEESPYEEDAKWEALKIFHHPESYYNEASAILIETMRLMESEYGSQIAAAGQEFYDYWNNFQENGNNIIDTLLNKRNVTWNFSDKGVVLVPMLFLPLAITISLDSKPNHSRDVVRLSILFDERFDLAGKKATKEDVLQVGKLLSDKSKIDILEYISRKPSYGKEIADELNLSTATISYHMNALLNTGFINANVDANKVYYSLNSERIATSIDDVKKYFTEL